MARSSQRDFDEIVALARELDQFVLEHPETGDYESRLPAVNFLRERGLDDQTIEASLGLILRPEDRVPVPWIQ
jgi:hypothetical protein